MTSYPLHSITVIHGIVHNSSHSYVWLSLCLCLTIHSYTHIHIYMRHHWLYFDMIGINTHWQSTSVSSWPTSTFSFPTHNISPSLWVISSSPCYHTESLLWLLYNWWLCQSLWQLNCRAEWHSEAFNVTRQLSTHCQEIVEYVAARLSLRFDNVMLFCLTYFLF
jgi:hypothetical protein